MLEYVSEPESHPLYMFHAVKFMSTVLPHEKPNSTRHSCEHKPWETLHRSHRFYSDFHRESFEVWAHFHELEWGKQLNHGKMMTNSGCLFVRGRFVIPENTMKETLKKNRHNLFHKNLN